MASTLGPQMLPPAGQPVSGKPSAEGASAVEGAPPLLVAGEAPAPEQRAAIADLHEPEPSLPKGGRWCNTEGGWCTWKPLQEQQGPVAGPKWQGCVLAACCLLILAI